MFHSPSKNVAELASNIGETLSEAQALTDECARLSVGEVIIDEIDDFLGRMPQTTQIDACRSIAELMPTIKANEDIKLSLLRHICAEAQSYGRPDVALAIQRQIVELLQSSLGFDHFGLRHDARLLAELLDAAGEKAEADALRHRAQIADQRADEIVFSPVVLAGSSQPLTQEVRFELVPVQFSTHRQRTGRPNPYEVYRAQRRDVSAGLDYGRSIVSVPVDRKKGDLPLKRSFWLDRRPDQSKHMVVLEITPVKADGDAHPFFADIAKSLDGSDRRELMISVHGYRSSLYSSIARTAQLFVDLDIDGAAMVYSWPSANRLFSYRTDQGRALLSYIKQFTTMVKDLIRQARPRRVYILAHSMGNRFLIGAIDRFATEIASGALTAKISDHTVFASPDVDPQEFLGVLPAAQKSTGRFTLYASDGDYALKASSVLNAFVPAGVTRAAPLMAGLDVIDTTNVAGALPSHDDYASSGLMDLRALFWHDLPPEKRRRLIKVTQNSGLHYWQLVPPQTPGEDDEFELASKIVRRLGHNRGMEYCSGQQDMLHPVREQRQYQKWQRVQDMLRQFT